MSQNKIDNRKDQLQFAINVQVCENFKRYKDNKLERST